MHLVPYRTSSHLDYRRQHTPGQRSVLHLYQKGKLGREDLSRGKPASAKAIWLTMSSREAKNSKRRQYRGFRPQNVLSQ